MPAPLPDDVRRFLLTRVPSVPYLEALLLLKADPSRDFRDEEVAARLYLPPRLAGELLEALTASGIASRSPEGHRYSPRDNATATLLDSVAGCYHVDLIGVTRLIHDATGKNAQRFADAFKLRREP